MYRWHSDNAYLSEFGIQMEIVYADNLSVKAVTQTTPRDETFHKNNVRTSYNGYSYPPVQARDFDPLLITHDNIINTMPGKSFAGQRWNFLNIICILEECLRARRTNVRNSI